MRIIFAGSPAIAVPCLEALASDKSINLIGVLTNPDTPKGRHGTPQSTEVGEAAEKLGVSILKPVKLDAAAREIIAALKPDMLVTFAYGKIFGPKFLALFPLGGINIHPSLLPKYRGPTPIQASILNRDKITGISIQKIALEIDSGNILAAEQMQLDGTETTASLSLIAAVKAAEMLPLALGKIAAGEQGTPQNHNQASYCRLINKDDGIIDWGLSAAEIDAGIRAYNPWPLYRTIHNGKTLFILKAGVLCGGDGKAGQVLGINNQYGIMIQAGNGILAVSELQYQGKKALYWKDFLNGARDFIGSNLT
ncbi:MAG: methionyl-tRNA formyltransferase [Treponema sp.]|jgi:methionyl-tRNA formyltransferase|nr:methionyl-tRNA formyltransferase [Treponema sp.]